METSNALAATCAPAGAERAFHSASVLSTGRPNSALARWQTAPTVACFVNIGEWCYALEFMQLWSQHHDRAPLARAHQAHLGVGWLRGRWSCGTCNDCARHYIALGTRGEWRAHALELGESNRQLLRTCCLRWASRRVISLRPRSLKRDGRDTHTQGASGDEREPCGRTPIAQSSVRLSAT